MQSSGRHAATSYSRDGKRWKDNRRSTGNHPLQLQGILLVTLATKGLSDFETKQLVSNVAVEILKENETASQHNSPGLPQFQRNEVAVLLFERNRRLFQTD